ncbi:hypothetical protein BC831DRAFT_514104 [Entophlyctis helioformis]|nr:hypothetical protein BC831DRAFT_514104 [Entophlyctis helioformis]
MRSAASLAAALSPSATDSDLSRLLKKLLTQQQHNQQQPVSLATLADRTLLGHYSSLAAFQTDLSLVVRHALVHYPAAHAIHQAARSLDRLATRLIHSSLAQSQPAHAPSEPPLPAPPANKTVLDLALGKYANIRRQKTALVQRGTDGTFYFTGAHPHPIDSFPLGDVVSKVKVIPTPSLPASALPVLAVSTRPPKRQKPLPPRKIPAGIPVAPVEYRDYGVFSSFAPVADSSRASVSVSESSMMFLRSLRVEMDYVDEQPLPETVPSFNGISVDVHGAGDPAATGLRSIPVEAIVPPRRLDDLELARLEAPEKAKLDPENLAPLTNDPDWSLLLPLLRQDSKPETVAKLLDQAGTADLLAQNATLLQRLLAFQSERLKTRNVLKRKTSGGPQVEIEELQCAQALKQNLTALTKRVAPSDLVTADLLADAWTLVNMYEPGFKGTLPPHKPFAFLSNEVGNTIFPREACSNPANAAGQAGSAGGLAQPGGAPGVAGFAANAAAGALPMPYTPGTPSALGGSRPSSGSASTPQSHRQLQSQSRSSRLSYGSTTRPLAQRLTQ